MKKYFVTAMVLLATTTAVFAQKKHKNPPPQPATSTDSAKLVNKALQSAVITSTEPAKPKKAWDLTKRSADHFMFELGYDNWASKPDSANISGLNHSLNFYFMMDFPFKSDPRLSMGVGAGLGSSQIYFNKTYPQIAAYNNASLVFATSVSGGGGTGGTTADHYKRFKLVTNYLEFPVELRFALDPEHMDKSWKFAVGTKIGLLLTAYTKAVDPEDVSGHVLAGVVEKESSKQFFSSFKFAPTFRVSKGVIGIFGQFQANSLLKGSAGYSVFPFAGGIVLSGL